MNSYHYLIIGGGIAGVTAAETIREHDRDATICVISHEAHLPYSRVLLPAYLKRKIPREKLFLRTIDDFIEARIEIRLQQTVTAIDENRREVALQTGATLGYKKLLIASGGQVKPWGRPEDQSVIYRLQTLDDADRLFAALASITNPLVIGSSFISLEFLEIFLANKINPAILMRDEHFFGQYLDQSGGELMRAHFQRHHIPLYEHDEIEHLKHLPADMTILTKKQQTIACDSLAVGVGIDRNFLFLGQSTIVRGQSGIRANEFFETSHENIYAAGDVAELLHPATQTYRTTGNWTSAFLQGKYAGLAMAGLKAPFLNTPSYSITNLGLQITMVGECANDPLTGGDTIVRIDTDTNQYERLFFREGTLKGAVLINRFKDKTHLTRLIESAQKLDTYREDMALLQFDITTIPVV